MDTVQFRDFIFPHNPRSIKVSGGANVAVHLCPGRGETAQHLGARARTVICEGCFFGDSYGAAAGQLNRLREAGAGKDPGMLYIPGLAPFSAYLRELDFTASGDGRVLEYTLVFLESGAGA